MLIFAATAGFAQVLGIGWKNKVLQLATALSFYSAVDLIVSLGSVTTAALRPWSHSVERAYLSNWAFSCGSLQLKMYDGVNSVHKWNSFWLHLLDEPSSHGRRWFGRR